MLWPKTQDQKGCDTDAPILLNNDTDATQRPDQENPHWKGSRMWRLLHDKIHLTVDKVKRFDFRPSVLTHGIQQVRHLSSTSPICHMTYNWNAKKFVSLDSEGCLRIYHYDGRLMDNVTVTQHFKGISSTMLPDHYVAWGSENSLFVLNADFHIVSNVQATQDIQICAASEWLEEVVTAGAGNICFWCICPLICKVEITEGLTGNEVFTQLLLPKMDNPGSQKCFAVCRNGVAMFNISKRKLMVHKKDLHLRKITGIAYCHGLQWLVTAARDGSIKVWDKAWRLQMVFVGHTAPVTALVTFPHVPHLLSASQDGTMRVWNLETADQVEEIQTVHVALGLGVSEDNTGEADCTGLIFSFSSQGVDFWDLTQLYNILTPLEAPVRSIQTTVLHRFPPRAVCVCEDASIRLIAAETGDIITSFLMEEPRQIRSVDYCLPLETLFVVTDKGEVLRINALTNPASLVDRSFERHGGVDKKQAVQEQVETSDMGTAKCLVMYNYIVEEDQAYSAWTEVVESKGKGWQRKNSPFKQQINRFLLVVGHEHGYLSVLDWDTRLPAYKTEAHSSCCVSALIACPESNYVISTGGDKMVKVWRVFPYADESLSLHMSFCCAQPPLKVSCLGSLLAVAFQELSSATYGIVHYHLETKNRSDHPPKDDPQDLITGLCACSQLNIFASSSKDGIIKIWDHRNRLLRTLSLNAGPESVAFCSKRGDLLVGIQSHLYEIHYTKVLPRHYYSKFDEEFTEPVPDSTIPASKAALHSLDSSLMKKLKEPPLSSRPTQRSEEDEEYENEQREMEKGRAALAVRDKELLLIKQGNLLSRRKPVRTKETQREAFKQYMQLFYKGLQPPVKILEDDSIDDLEPFQTPRPPPRESPFIPEREKGGFFPSPALARPLRQGSAATSEASHQESEQLPSHGVSPVLQEGTFPNSVLLSQLWPPEAFQKTEDEEASPRKEPARANSYKMKLKFLEEAKLEEEQEEEEEDDEEESSFAALMAMIDQVPVRESPKLSPEPEIKNEPEPELELKCEPEPAAQPHVEPKDEPEPIPRAQTEKPKVKQLSPVMKHILLPQPSPPPPPPAEPPSSPSPVPLPSFISQFTEQDWFKRVFPESVLKPLSARFFTSILLQKLKTEKYQIKTDILGALVILHQQDCLENLEEMREKLLSVLNYSEPPSLTKADQRQFIGTALSVLTSLYPSSREVLIELLVQLIEADLDFRKRILIWLKKLGLEDPNNYLCEELDSWNLWIEERAPSKAELHNIIDEWLELWSQKFKFEHVKVFVTEPPDAAPFRPIDAVNFFCKMQLRKELAAGPLAPLQRGQQRDTVLVLPDIHRSRPILRLGETGSFTRRQKVKGVSLPPLSHQYLLSGFVPHIALPLPKVELSPFPLQKSAEQDASHSLVRSLNWVMNRYFFVEHSYADGYR
ncbi:WD repeat-containing protein 97 [Polypterus senegalus]|uniref:WD repeat-containing protein 97 n=1 Tax=Polypterus senegalus TaxID=55291 RepID=UPI0019669DF6|nr:WD repeat-containing protein 97 [Polypterus senegalus]XP_039609722.1 WD repeat-containing protein 97 [Polypterus senegalus]XP_039609723.1 WD repeat-containing protein 97 [Polypterus senegalus]